ncbi:hypothetical protein MMC17_005525 [Xylographa soralifera]|nr:hypothetical protein [Xylographa soralifera]
MSRGRELPDSTSGINFRKLSGGPNIRSLLIVIPGIGTRAPEEWTDSNGQLWLSNVTDDIASKPAVFVYNHGQIPSDAFTWQGLIDAGNMFLVDLAKLRDAEESFCYANERSFQFKLILRATAGIIFLGTPHSISEEEKDWQNVTYAMRPAGSVKKKSRIAKEDARKLASTALRFEQSVGSIPVLSIYETQRTKVRYSIISSEKIFIVEKSSVQTSLGREEILDYEADHNNLCNISTSSRIFGEICTFIRLNFADAQSRMRAGSPKYEAPSALDHLTVRSSGSKDSLVDQNNTDPLTTGTVAPMTRKESASTQQTQRATANSSESAAFEMIPRVSDFSVTRKEPQLPCYIIPYNRNRDFLGRDKILKAIDDVFWHQSTDNEQVEPAKNELRAYAICGPAGIGKTQVAIEYVNSRRHRFDAVLWVHADQPEKLAEGFGHIAMTMGLAPKDSAEVKDQVVAREVVKGWLANPLKSYHNNDQSIPESATWLLIFDNVDDPEILTDFWPLDGPGCVLVTSRDPLSKKNGFSTTVGIDLEPLSSEQGAELLLKTTQRETQATDRTMSIDVAERLGGFPLAITQMAGVITRLNLTFGEFLKTYEEEKSRAELLDLRLEHPGRRSAYKHTIASAWAVESLKEGAILLDLLALFDPDGIQESIFTTAPSLVSMEGFPKSSVAYQRARSELFRSSLVTRDRTETKLIIHRLIQDTARSQMSQDRFGVVFSAAVVLLCSVWPFDTSAWQHGVARWILCEELFPHVLRLRQFSQRFVQLDGNYEAKVQFARLLSDAGWSYLERGHPAESEAFYELAEALCMSSKSAPASYIAMNLQGNSITKTIDGLLSEIYHHSGCAATVTNKPSAALSRFQIFNKIMLEQVDTGTQKDNSSLAISWNELGVAHMMNRQWAEGEKCFLLSIDVMKRLDNFTKTMMSFPLVNLGLVYWLTERYDESIQVLLEGLGDREAAFGVDDRISFITGRFLHALGNVKGSQGFQDESFTYHQRALIQYKSTVGNGHHRTAALCFKVAEHYIRLQQDDAAMKLLDQALKVYGDRPEYRPEKARVQHLRGHLLALLNQQESATVAFNESFHLYRMCSSQDKRPPEELRSGDFDDLIVFWSK